MKTIPLTKILFLLAALSLGACSQNTEAAGKGTVKIVTDPGDAKIYINGKRKGNSPAKKGQTFAIKLTEGEYDIEAVKPVDDYSEYVGAKKGIFVAEDTLQTITIDLQKRLTPLGEKRAQAEKERKEKEEQLKRAKLEARFKELLPEMVSIPAGSFRMGCVSGKNCNSDEKPVHRVQVPAFEMSKYEITFEQWDLCVEMGGCDHLPDDEGWGRGDRPVINVSWKDVQGYIRWLNRKTGKHYRLPSEAEWEYAARAGTETKYPWGNDIGRNHANCRGCGSQWDNEQTAPVGSFAANGFGLHDMHGNVWEWVQDCWNDSYEGAPTDGSAWESGNCGRRMLRGGSWSDGPRNLHSAYRFWYTTGGRYNFWGFRLARTVTP